MASKNAYNIALRHQVALERLKAGYVKDYGKTLKQLDREIREILSSIKVKTLNDLTKKQSVMLMDRLKSRQAAIYAAYNKELLKSLEALAVHEAQVEAEALKRHMAEAAIALKLLCPVAIADKVFDRPISYSGELLKSFIENFSNKEMATVENSFRRGYAEAWTVQQLVDAIGGTKAASFKDGVLGRNDSGAAAVVKTAVQHVSQAARIAIWSANVVIVGGYRWVSTLDSKTTQVCRSLDGKHFLLGKGPLPPMHQACRSTTVPIGSDRRINSENRKSEAGYVPANQTYYDWLKTQDNDFQDFAIGPTRGKLLRESGLNSDEFARLNLGKNFEPLTLEEMKKKAPQAFELAGLK